MRCTIEATNSNSTSQQKCNSDQSELNDVNLESKVICEKRIKRSKYSGSVFVQNEGTSLQTEHQTIDGCNSKNSIIQKDGNHLKKKSSFCNDVQQGITSTQSKLHFNGMSSVNIHRNEILGQQCMEDDCSKERSFHSSSDSQELISGCQSKIFNNVCSSDNSNKTDNTDAKNETFNCQSEIDSEENNGTFNNEEINGSFESTVISQGTDHSMLNSSFDLFDTFSSHCSGSKASSCMLSKRDTEFGDLIFSNEDTCETSNTRKLCEETGEEEDKTAASSNSKHPLESESASLDNHVLELSQDSTKRNKGQKRKFCDYDLNHIANNKESLGANHFTNSLELNCEGNGIRKKIKEVSDNERLKEIQSRRLSTPVRRKSVHLHLENGINSTVSPSSSEMHSSSSLMLLSPAQLTKKNKRGEGLLHIAAIKGNLEDAKWLLEKGVNPNDRDNAGWSPLHEACNHGHTAIAKMLLDYGAIIDLPGGEDHDTPLHDAVANGRVATAGLLIQQGAPLSVRNKKGLTPLDYAITDEIKSVLQSPETPTGKTPIARKTVRCLEMHHQQTPKVILCSGLKPEQKAALEKCIKMNGGKYVTGFSPEVTHLVTSTNDAGHCARTIKYLSALLSGKWIVSFKWIAKCVSVKSWADESPYEVKGTSRAKQSVPRYSRINAENQLPGLFDGCQFYFNGIFDPQTPQKDTLIQLVQYGGGKVLTREPKAETNYELFLPRKDSSRMPLADLPVVAYHAKPDSAQYRCTRYVVYDPLTQCKPTYMYHQLSIVPVSWFLDCISNFEIMDIPP